MNEHTLKVLEFALLKELLAKHAACALGLNRIEGLEPTTDDELARRWLAEVSEMQDYLAERGRLPLDGLVDLSEDLRLASLEGSILPADRLLAIKRVVRAVEGLQKALRPGAERWPLLWQHLSLLDPPRTWADSVERCIEEDGAIADGASPELRKVRQGLQRERDAVHRSLNRLIANPHLQRSLSEPVVTLREGRYVLPVRVECRSELPGLVHDRSASGATLFIEPLEVVERNNHLRELQAQEQEEIRRILFQLTDRLRSCLPAVRQLALALGEMDFISARALFGRSFGGVCPTLVREPLVRLREARHPLLERVLGREAVVPLTMELGGSCTCLVITGPNTGGKTVALKTLGLLTLMAQSGLPIPAAEGSSLGVFHGVYADIGDEQDLQQSLSTFSGHMTQIVRILAQATDRSLVLLDELGAGTDPSEGAALGIAILSDLLRRRVLCLATTHHNPVKAFAYDTEGASNASVEFDLATLKPTYRLLIGTPGSSNALAMARRLGLPESILDRARGLIDSSHARVEDLLQRLEQEQSQLREARVAAEGRLQDAETLKATSLGLIAEAEGRSREVLQEARQQARQILADAESEARVLLRLTRQAKTPRRGKAQPAVAPSGGPVAMDQEAATALQEAIEQARRKREALAEQAAEADRAARAQEEQPRREATVGDLVQIASFAQQGVLLDADQRSGIGLVQVGALRLRAQLADLISLGAGPDRREARISGGEVLRDGRAAELEVKLLGLRVEEALARLDKFLDDALLMAIPQVRIIHGIGTGRLQAAVAKYLATSTSVASFHPAEPEEGGAGATIAVIRRE